MQEYSPPPPPRHVMTLFDQLQGGGLSGWIILFLALLLLALFVTMLLGRRSYGSIIGYFAASLLPLMAGLCGVAAGAITAFQNLATAGIADPAQLSNAIGSSIISLYMGAGVSFLGLSGTMILALVGPSKVAGPPPVPH